MMRFASAKRIELICPFVKLGIVREIVASIQPGAHLSLVTRAKAADFAAGASDIDALRTLFAAAEALGLRLSLSVNNAVHAKIFIFDDNVCYVGSSNLTASGLERSLEGTVEMTEPQEVKEWREAFGTIRRKATDVHLEDLAEFSKKARAYLLTHKVEKADEGLFYDQEPNLEASKAVERVYQAVEAENPNFAPGVQERIDAIVEQQLDAVPAELPLELETKDVPPGDIGTADQEVVAEAPPRRLSDEKAKILQEFVELAKNSFGLPSWSYGISVAHAVVHPSVFDLIENVEIDGRSLAIPRKVHSSLRQLGFDTFSAMLAILFVRSGLLTRYGPAFCSTLEAAIRGNGFLHKTWKRRFLPDPVMTESDEKSLTIGSRTMKRLREDEAYRLFAFASVSLPFDDLVQFIEENWNPVVEYGSSVVELGVSKDPKTRVQEIAAQAKIAHRYGDYVNTGTEHKPQWNCVLELVGKAKVAASGDSKRVAEMDAAARIEHAMLNDPQWRTAKQAYRRQIFRSYVESGPWPLACKEELDTGTRGILSDFLAQNHLAIDPRQLLGRLVNAHVRALDRVRFNNASLAFLGSFVLRWIVSERIVKEGQDLDHAGLANRVYTRIGGVSGIRELYQRLGWGRYASDGAVTEGLQSLLASLVQFDSAEAAKRYTYRLVDMIQESSLTEFVSDGRVQSKIELVIAGLERYDSKGDYITLLQEFVQHFDKTPPEYDVVRIGGPDHAPTFQGSVAWRAFSGKGRIARSGKEAKREAAYALLLQLKGYSPKPSSSDGGDSG